MISTFNFERFVEITGYVANSGKTHQTSKRDKKITVKFDGHEGKQGDRYVRDIWLPPAAYGLLMDRRIDVCHSIRRHLLLEKILPCCSLFQLVPGKCDLLTGGGNGPMSPKHQLMFDVQHFEKS